MTAAVPANRVSRVAIAGELTIQNAASVRAQLLVALRDGGVVEIDLTEVGEFDSAGLQLLVAARKSAEIAGKRLQLAGPSPAVAEVLEFLAMLDEFTWTGEAAP
jgi:anti-anti-sigma factor